MTSGAQDSIFKA